IGKTTGDDPFTPSWRLIGGYWQWGRKGPSPAELTIRLNNIVQIEAGNNPVEGFSAITFSVGGTEVIVDITTIADDDTLDATTAYDEIVDAINAQLMAEGLDNVTATRGQIETVCFSTSIAGFTLGDCVGEYYTIIVTNTGPGQFVKGYFTEQQLDYETELNCSFITSSWYDTNTANFAHGPTGPDEADANDNSIDGWDESYAPDGAWLDSYKTSNDPCLPGFRVPTKSQWDGVNENNNQEIVGTWTGYNTNYNSGRFFGDYLMLPAAGFRGGDSLSERGDFARYWSSTEDADASYSAWGLYFGSSFNFTDSYLIRSTGFSVRCIAEDETQDDSVWYKDSDGDGYSDGENLISYTRPGDDYYLSTELIATVGDFDDNNYDVHPGADEICDNGIDDDCNGEIDEDCTAYSSECGAYIAPGVWKEFDCYNLAAIGKTTNDDPFTPSWRLIGGYWQWGRKGPDSSRWYNTNTSNFAHGPTGPDAADANDDSISGWDGSYAPDGAWSDSEKTSNDPCPLGYRVPTKTQWAGVIDNNTQRAVGTWSTSEGQYNSGLFFGDNLMLPAAGNRYFKSGSLDDINTWAIYWSSTEDAKNNYCSNSLDFYGSGAWTGSNELRFGVSVRCIAE
ncbi:MAG: MopE-related protein, partial [Thermodesulfobacteriota bacterium]